MEYRYCGERQENQSNPETSQTQGHQHNQQAIQYQHQQQYPPAPAHHAIQPGYPGLRFPPFVNPLQGGGPSPSQPPGQGGVLPTRVPSSEASSTAASGRAAGVQRGHEFENVPGAAMHLGGMPLAFRPDVANSEHAMPLQQVRPPSTTVAAPQQHQPQSEKTAPDLGYLIHDLSNSVRSRGASSQNSVSAAATTTVITANRRKVGVRQQRSKRSTIPESMGPAVDLLEQQAPRPRRPRQHILVTFNKACQTEPLFGEPRRDPGMGKDLPEGLGYGEVDDATNKGRGVFALRDLELGQKFGPFTGDFVLEGLGCYDPSTWEICVKGRTWFYVDGGTDSGNWMNQVAVARSKDEQNLEAFQCYGNIFFRTTKPIRLGMELRVFYSEEYSRCVGFRAGLDELHVDEDSQRFECQDCKCRYTNAKSLMRHLKFEHDKENNPDAVGLDGNDLREAMKEKIQNSQGKLKDDGRTRQKERNRESDKGKQDNSRQQGTNQPKSLPPQKKLRQRNAGCATKPESVNSFACKKCGKHFSSKGRLKEHAAFHPSTRGLKPLCEVCGLECKHNRALKQHMLSHDSSSFKCQHCKKYFRRKGCFVFHLRHDHGVSVGGKWMRGSPEEQMARYVGPDDAQEESEPFHPELPKDMLGKRILVSSKKPKVFKCKYCPKKFVAHHLVFKHERVAHTNTGRYKCELCPATFMEEYRFILHKRRHTKERLYKCPECPLSFASENALQNHEPEHRGERPFRCEVCGKGFRTRKYMTTHKRRQHTVPSVLLKCSFCDKTFKHKTGLVRHERCHKGIRPHVCLECGKAFGTKYSLQAHAHIHTGEKPFECKVCKRCFALNHHLITHMIRHEKANEASIVLTSAMPNADTADTSGDSRYTFVLDESRTAKTRGQISGESDQS